MTVIAHAIVMIHAINMKNVDVIGQLVTVMVTATGAEMIYVNLMIVHRKAVGAISLATQMAVCVMATITYACVMEVAIRITNVVAIMNVIPKNVGHVTAILLEARKV